MSRGSASTSRRIVRSPLSSVKPEEGGGEKVAPKPRSSRSSRQSGVPIGSMHVLRLGIVAVVLWSGFFGSLARGTEVPDIGLVALGYLAAIGLFDQILRRWRSQQASLSLLMLLADAFFLAWVLHVSGGMFSSLRFLVYIHLIAATLIYSYRVGIFATVVHSILLYVVYRSQGPVAVVETGGFVEQVVGEEAMKVKEAWIFNTLVYWLIELATAPFASVNERELRRRKEDLGIIAEVASELENIQRPEEIADALLQRLCDSLGFGRGVVLAVHDQKMVLMGARNAHAVSTESPRVDLLVDRAWDKHEAILAAQLNEVTDSTLSSLLPDARNLLIAPMFADGQPFGVIVVESARRDAPVIQRRIISLVMQMASHGALAMRNAWLLQQVQRMADTDALTGIANRRSFETMIDKEVSRSTRNGDELTLILLDLDHFKQLNDTHGHQAGDEMLRQVGGVLADACRASDTPARYGGEEFAVLLPMCGKAEAFETAERLRGLIGLIHGPRAMTVSAGVATYPIHGVTATDLVKAADEALYESKANGRDQTTISSRKLLRVIDSAEQA